MSVFVGVAAATLAVSASAETVVTVSKSQQRLSVTVDGTELYRWPVSTGRRGLATPSGTFHPIRFERKWYSRKYDWSPMPYSIFFHGGYALHGSYETRRLGHPASHGCVRMLPVNAAKLFALVRREGGSNARIVVTDRPLPPVGARPMARPFVQNVPLPRAAPDDTTAAIKMPARQIEIAVPPPPQFDTPKLMALASALPITLPNRDVPLPQKRATAAAEAGISVPLPPQHAPGLATLPEPHKLAEPLPAKEPAPKEIAHKTLASVQVPQVRAPVTKPAPHQVKQVREARAEAKVAGHASFTSVGSEADVMRGRQAWLRSLDRKYGIVR
jgi:hypothetical protein